jgi:hypothetical protein
MRRTRYLTIAALPLLATLLAAQPGLAQFNPFQLLAPQPAKPASAKPAPQAQQKKPASTSWHTKPAPAAAAAQKKPEAKTLEAKKPEAKKPEATKLEAKKFEAKTLEPKKPAPPKYELSDYYKVWGVTAGTTRKDILARFGAPQPGDSGRRIAYFNDTLVFFFDGDDTVSTMVVGNSFSAIPPNSIPRDVLDKAFIGRTRDDVLKAFGPAQVVSSDNYRYMPKAGVYKVEFQCYDIERHVCKQLLVQF